MHLLPQTRMLGTYLFLTMEELAALQAFPLPLTVPAYNPAEWALWDQGRGEL